MMTLQTMIVSQSFRPALPAHGHGRRWLMLAVCRLKSEHISNSSFDRTVKGSNFSQAARIDVGLTRRWRMRRGGIPAAHAIAKGRWRSAICHVHEGSWYESGLFVEQQRSSSNGCHKSAFFPVAVVFGATRAKHDRAEHRWDQAGILTDPTAWLGMYGSNRRIRPRAN